MSRKGLTISMIIALIVLLLCSCCMFILLLTEMGSLSFSQGEIIEKTKITGSSNKIAIIPIEGMIASEQSTVKLNPDMVEVILNKLDKATEDSSVKAIIVTLNTPGGTVYDSHIIAQKIKEVKQTKPVVALMEMTATSGGYYIAAPANRIIASETSLTGSIGVITQITNLEGLYEKLGIKVITVTNTQSDMKVLENIEDVSSEDRKILESVLNDYYETFIQTVSEGRNIPRESLLEIADGSIYSGKKAKDLNLIDELGTETTAIEAASELAGIENPTVVVYETYTSPFSSLGMFISNELNPWANVTSKLETDPGMYLYYLPE